MAIDTNKYKNLLEEERVRLEGELKSVGRVNPDNPKDWEPTPEPHPTLDADRNDAADRIEEYEDRTAILKDLEIRYNNVKAALARIEAGTYGICEIGGGKIGTDRLDANPAARTCKEHIAQEETLS